MLPDLNLASCIGCGGTLGLPWLISMSVMVCHLFMATNQVVPRLRQLRSMTNFDLSLSSDSNTACNRSIEKVAFGNR